MRNEQTKETQNMKKTLKTIGMLAVSGVSAWACGETFDWNKPLSMFFAALFIGILAAMFFEWSSKNEI